MYFPENYECWTQDPQSLSDVAGLANANETDVLFTHITSWTRVVRMVEPLLRQYPALPPRRWRFVHVADDLATSATMLTVDGPEHTSTEHPVWDLLTGEPEELFELCRTHREYIFVRLPDVLSTAYLKSDGVLRHNLPDLYTAARAVEGTGIKLIAFGGKDFRIQYLFGLDGSGERLRAKTARPTELLFRTGFGTPTMLRSTAQMYVPEAVSLAVRYRRRFTVELAEHWRGYAREQPTGSVRDFLKEIRKKKDTDYLDFEFVAKYHKNGMPWVITGDRVMCNGCSLKYACRLYQEGGVCILPSSKGNRLASFFNSRDSNNVIDGISELLQIQSERVEQALEAEQAAVDKAERDGEPVPMPEEITSKMINDLMRNGERFAKLVDPKLSSPKLALQINAGPSQVTAQRIEPSPRELAQAARELEESGVRRAEMTPKMIQDHLDAAAGIPIEGEIIGDVRHDF